MVRHIKGWKSVVGVRVAALFVGVGCLSIGSQGWAVDPAAKRDRSVTQKEESGSSVSGGGRIKPVSVVTETSQTKEAEVIRARRETTLLDTLYKNAIVLITTHYVSDSDSIPAGEAFKALFATMKKDGWHEVRLIDGLGDPVNDENTPKDDFEKSAMKEILAGKARVELVVEQSGVRELRTLTSVPMVMDKCILCHENYRGQKIVGALGYRLPLDVFTETKKN